MLYLLDANVLITANRDYYPIDRIPEFWEWLLEQGRTGNVKIPHEIYYEIKAGNDDLAKWVRQDDVGDALLLMEEADPRHVSPVVEVGYADDLTDDELEKIGRDPFLVAYALTDRENRTVVTTEGSRPKRQRANRHIPEVCISVNVKYYNTFEMIRELDFRTNWKSGR